MGSRLSTRLYTVVFIKCANVYFKLDSLHRRRGEKSPLDLTAVEEHEKEEEGEKTEKVEEIFRMPCYYLQYYTI